MSLPLPEIQPYQDQDGQWKWLLINHYRLFLPFDYPAEIVVPPGFTTDLASIPRWLQALFNPYDPWVVAGAVVHDWLTRHPLTISPQISAGIFHYVLRKTGAPKFRAKVYYLAVVLGIARNEW